MNSPALKRITQIFTPGTLQQKHEQISLFITGGHSLLYSGDVAWKLTIPSSDQVLKGDAESMDAALFQIKGLLEEVMKTLNPATKIALAVKEKEA